MSVLGDQLPCPSGKLRIQQDLSCVDPDSETGCAIALAELPKMGPQRLARLLETFSCSAAWRRVVAGDFALLHQLLNIGFKLFETWVSTARKVEPAQLLEKYNRASVDVWHVHGQYPDALRYDHERPAVFFTRGDIDALRYQRAGVIGTRRCTREGALTAIEFGRELASNGVAVVSGLALGIDGNAHEGVLECDPTCAAPPIAVVGSGLDVIYPRRNARLWHSVSQRGLIISEAPLNAQGEPWRFPARNRIIAALSHVLVVVESHEHGGSLLTVNNAIERDVPVMAVPSSRHNPAAAGTNAMLGTVANSACMPSDVLELLSITHMKSPTRAITRVPPLAQDLAVLGVVRWVPTSCDEIVLASGRSVCDVLESLERLSAANWIDEGGGFWTRLA